MKFLSDVFIISKIYSRWILRNPLLYFMIALALPLGITISIGLFAPPDLRGHVLSGSIILSLITSGMMGLGQDFAADRLTNRISLFVTATVSPLSYAIGVAAGNGLISLIGVAVLLVVGQVFLGVQIGYGFLLLIPVLLLSWLLSLSMGFLIGSYTKSAHVVGALTNLIMIIFVFFAPVYYPIEILPLPLRYVAYAIPTTYIAQAMRATFARDVRTVVSNMGILFVLTVIFTLISLKEVWWRER
jgi:ABC-2 type transport system permease protein